MESDLVEECEEEPCRPPLKRLRRCVDSALLVDSDQMGIPSLTKEDSLCSICLTRESSAALDGCDHTAFCIRCILQWAEERTRCPICRAPFQAIASLADSSLVIPVGNADEGPSAADERCVRCGTADHEEALLICDACERLWHLWCCQPPLRAVPETPQWFCSGCLADQQRAREAYWRRERARAVRGSPAPIVREGETDHALPREPPRDGGGARSIRSERASSAPAGRAPSARRSSYRIRRRAVTEARPTAPPAASPPPASTAALARCIATRADVARPASPASARGVRGEPAASRPGGEAMDEGARRREVRCGREASALRGVTSGTRQASGGSLHAGRAPPLRPHDSSSRIPLSGSAGHHAMGFQGCRAPRQLSTTLPARPQGTTREHHLPQLAHPADAQHTLERVAPLASWSETIALSPRLPPAHIPASAPLLDGRTIRVAPEIAEEYAPATPSPSRFTAVVEEALQTELRRRGIGLSPTERMQLLGRACAKLEAHYGEGTELDDHSFDTNKRGERLKRMIARYLDGIQGAKQKRG